MSREPVGPGPHGRSVVRLPLALLCLAFAAAIATALGPTFGHLGEEGWSTHARFHVLREVFLATFFSAVGIALCLGPLRRRRPWAWWAVLIVGVGVVGGFYVGLPITGVGMAGVGPYLNHGAQLLLLAGGLALARREVRP